MFLVDAGIRRQLIMALTEDSKLHIQEVCISNSYIPNEKYRRLSEHLHFTHIMFLNLLDTLRDRL